MVCDGQLRKDLVCLCDTVWILAVPLLVEPLQIPLQIQRAANTVVAGPYFERHALDVMIWESLQSLHTAAEKSLNVSRCCDANFSGPLVRQDKLRLQRDGYGEETVGTKESASLQRCNATIESGFCRRLGLVDRHRIAFLALWLFRRHGHRVTTVVSSCYNREVIVLLYQEFRA